MKKPTLKFVVPVSFTGTVVVEVPASVPKRRREALARKVALARLLPTTRSPDAREDDACAEYRKEFGLGRDAADRDWEGCLTPDVSGSWSLDAAADRAAAVKQLTDRAEAAGLQPEDLDELVHDLASGVASGVNNGGLDEQVGYLVEKLGVQGAEQQIGELIEEHKERQGKGE
jgi:hypothetical protein